MNSKVSIVKSASRRDGIFQSMELIRQDLQSKIKGTVVIKPNLGCGYIPKQKAASHVDALRGVLDFINTLDMLPEMSTRR